MHDVPHFQEAGRINPVSLNDQLPEAIYGRTLDFLVFACVDLVFTYQNQMLLAKRKTAPRSSWWISEVAVLLRSNNELDRALLAIVNGLQKE